MVMLPDNVVPDIISNALVCDDVDKSSDNAISSINDVNVASSSASEPEANDNSHSEVIDCGQSVLKMLLFL